MSEEMESGVLWGEIPESKPADTVEDKAATDVKPLAVRGATLYQPSQTKPVKKEIEEWIIDPVVLHTIKLLSHCRHMRDLIQNSQNMLENQGMGGGSELDSAMVPGSCPAPPLSPTVSTKQGPAWSNWKTPVEINGQICRNLLRRSVGIISAHAGYESGYESALWVLTDLAHEFLSKITALLRSCQEREGATGFPEVIERALHESGMGGARVLVDWYETRIRQYHSNLQQTVNKLHEQYELLCSQENAAASNNKRFYLDDSDIEGLLSVPELHVSSLEGQGQQMEMGLHVLHSLEGGENIEMPIAEILEGT